MYSNETQLTERIAIIDEISVNRDLKAHYVLPPENHAEIIVPIDSDLSMKMIGSAKNINIIRGTGLFLSPRGRGMEVQCNCSFLHIKISPIYAKSFQKDLAQLSNGVYKFPFKRETIDHLVRFSDKSDCFAASDLFSEYLDDSAYQYNYTILDSIDQIKDSKGIISVKEIYSNLNVSKSKLEQHFNREIGLTPKEFCKIEKMKSFIELYNSSENKSLTELTYKGGYYDQSHLIKDFRYFLDMSPRMFLAQKTYN